MHKYNKIKKLYFHTKEIPDNYFLSRTGRLLTVEAIERIYKKAGEYAGVRSKVRCSPHTARHYFAVKILQSPNIDLHTISLLLGHTKISTTQIYLASLTDERVIDQGKISSPLMNLK